MVEDQVGAFWRDVAELDDAGRNTFMNLIVTGYPDHRVDSTCLPSLLDRPLQT